MSQPPLTVPALLAHSVREFGERTYLVTPTDRLTYVDADRRSADLARWLLAQGVGNGTRVGLFFANGTQWVTWWLAVSRIGAIAVPLSTIYRPAEIAKVVRLADIGLPRSTTSMWNRWPAVPAMRCRPTRCRLGG